MTVLEAIQRSTDFLQKKGVESARLNTELLLAHLLKVPRMNLYLAFDRMLDDTETVALRELVVRRGRREPLQHIVGTASFCGHEILVDQNVLIPRPETELLAQTGIEVLKGMRDASQCGWRILDLCTGSGCIAITLASSFASAHVTASDFSPEALEIARQNVSRRRLEERIRLVQSDLFKGLPKDAPFDLIVSNPPYIPTTEIQTLQPEIRDFEPHAALDGGSDGLDFYRRIAAEGTARLAPRGAVVLEFGDGQASAIEKTFQDQNWIVEPPREDYTRRLRILVARRNSPA